VKQGNQSRIDQANQAQAVRLTNFLSAAVQMMPIELCGDLVPKLLSLAEIEDSLIKTKAYLTVEVLFACRRFECEDKNIEVVVTRTLKHLLDNPELISSMVVEEGGETAEKLKVEGKDENKVIAYI